MEEIIVAELNAWKAYARRLQEELVVYMAYKSEVTDALRIAHTKGLISKEAFDDITNTLKSADWRIKRAHDM